MRETRPSGSEGGARESNRAFLPLLPWGWGPMGFAGVGPRETNKKMLTESFEQPVSPKNPGRTDQQER
jgi:hypothetical protein